MSLPEPVLWLLLLLGGVVAGFFNVVAGGGSLISLPLMIACGLSESSANGTLRLPIIVQNLLAVWRYW
ncbi:MAG: TSUP family transporter [Myxococcota bacterium]